jgi:hypothetical protein
MKFCNVVLYICCEPHHRWQAMDIWGCLNKEY